MFKAIIAICALSTSLLALASDPSKACTEQGWLDKEDATFAADCVGMAFRGSLKDRQRLAWMFFARINTLIQNDPLKRQKSSSTACEHADASQDSPPCTETVPVWMAWPTDPDTFNSRTPFVFQQQPRAQMMSSQEKKSILAGHVSTTNPNGSNEEVTRNQLSYDYLVQSGLTTKLDVAAFFLDNDYVDMPVGSVELKASWLQVSQGSPAPRDAFVYDFDGGAYWLRGLHIMVKMQSLPDPKAMFYSEQPSWFWTTFEFSDNPGVAHVRDQFITQRAPLKQTEIKEILGPLAELWPVAYSPNGTQIRFTENGTGHTPVILGHTNMEDFAGAPNAAQPQYWDHFESSCHSCHATAAYNPMTKIFFPFSVPKGILHPAYNQHDKSGNVQYLGQGFKPLDFMWPIVFRAR